MEGIESSLKQERERLGLSQKQLAAQIGISERSIFNFEKGRAPSLQTAIRLSAYFGIPVEQLFRIPDSAVVFSPETN